MSKLSVPREFLGAFKQGHRRSSVEFIDEELSLLLLARVEAGCEKSRAELEWLTRFNNEYHKGVVHGRAKEGALHNTKELRQDCDARNYARRNDIYTSVTLVHWGDFSPQADEFLYWSGDGRTRRTPNIEDDEF